VAVYHGDVSEKAMKHSYHINQLVRATEIFELAEGSLASPDDAVSKPAWDILKDQAAFKAASTGVPSFENRQKMISAFQEARKSFAQVYEYHTNKSMKDTLTLWRDTRLQLQKGNPPDTAQSVIPRE
jgi:hypothetical protein